MDITEYITSETTSESRHILAEARYALWDNPADPISSETRKKINLANRLIAVLLITVLGVPGNIVSAVVFYRQGLRERINLCLFALAIVDIVVVLVYLIFYFESQLRESLFPHLWFFSTNIHGLSGFVWASQFLSAVIASERCFCVVSPFHAKRLLKTSTMAAIIVVGCLVLVGGMCAIAGPKYTVINLVDSFFNTSEESIYVTRYYLDNKYVLDFFAIFVYATCLPGIFVIVIVITTFITIIKLRAAAYQRKHMTSSNRNRNESFRVTASLSSKEIAVTRMLIGTSILFLICLAPNLVGQVTTFIVPDLNFSGRYYNMNWVMRDFVFCFRNINCSVNICVYYALGSNFRQTVRAFCHYCFCK